MISDRDNLINNWKVMCAKAIGNGKFGEQISSKDAPLILSAPETICSSTFIQIGNFSEIHNNETIKFGKNEALNLIKYMQTKFFRCMLDIKKITQDINRAKFEYVPVQDFTKYSDIDWSKSLDEIDDQLFKKYQLSNDEINFIKNNVQSQNNYYTTLPKNLDLNQNN